MPPIIEPVAGSRPASVAILVSGAGSLMAALIEAAADEHYPGSVVAVVGDRDCVAVGVAADRGLPVSVVAPADFAGRAEWDRALTAVVGGHRPDLIVTAGFMRILGPVFLGAFGGRIINSHPALLPAFPGAQGVRDALEYGVKVTGCTVHLVDSGVDTGPILAQRVVEVAVDDDENSLHERIKAVERGLLVRVVADVIAKGVVSDGRRARIQ